jgi:hypothetical protein
MPSLPLRRSGVLSRVKRRWGLCRYHFEIFSPLLELVGIWLTRLVIGMVIPRQGHLGYVKKLLPVGYILRQHLNSA